MLAAISAARSAQCMTGKMQITIYEKNDRIGKKILATGNGKCNFSNRIMDGQCYRGGDRKKVEAVLEQFSTEDCVHFFQELGMLIKDRNSYLYPASEQASTVLDLLRMQLAFLNISIVTECEILSVQKNDGTKQGFCLTGMHAGKREDYEADKVILAAGGIAGVRHSSKEGAYGILKKMGLPIVPVVPSLVQLRCREEYLKAVAGVRLEGEATLYINGQETCRERGELQLTDYGVSGIPIFQLSRYAAYALQEKKDVKLSIDCLPGFGDKEYDAFCRERTVQSREQTAEEFFLGICNKKVILLFLKLAGIKPTERIAEVPLQKKETMFQLFRRFPLNVYATNSFEQAQVCAGGLSLKVVDENLQVQSVPGLFVTGELLDVDGRCGGYNLQWAFASGYIAGRAAAEEA